MFLGDIRGKFGLGESVGGGVGEGIYNTHKLIYSYSSSFLTKQQNQNNTQ